MFLETHVFLMDNRMEVALCAESERVARIRLQSWNPTSLKYLGVKEGSGREIEQRSLDWLSHGKSTVTNVVRKHKKTTQPDYASAINSALS